MVIHDEDIVEDTIMIPNSERYYFKRYLFIYFGSDSVVLSSSSVSTVVWAAGFGSGTKELSEICIGCVLQLFWYLHHFSRLRLLVT